jgi:epoxyqueuosine reductase
MTIEQKLKAEAERLGFFISGITTPDPPASFPVYSSWVELGHHAEMEYLATQRALSARADPLYLLPECQSILVLGMPYAHPLSSPSSGDQSDSPITGKIAAYAWGKDYHDIITPRCEALVSWLQGQLGMEDFPWKGYTDTGPLLERDLAMRAGLGWIGRNSNLIHPKIGSHFFLAEILLPVKLKPDQPFLKDQCGSCQRCIQACPTGCILPNRTIDASRCISYLTIENKTDIPANLRPQLGNRVFGCDVCQSVCPWNRKSTRSVIDPAFHPGNINPYLDLHTVFDLSPQEFNQHYRGTPLKRSKRRGILRNCAVVLGNTSNTASIPVLEKVILSEFEPLVRGHAAWALGNFQDIKALGALKSAQKSEKDPHVLFEINNALED